MFKLFAFSAVTATASSAQGTPELTPDIIAYRAAAAAKHSARSKASSGSTESTAQPTPVTVAAQPPALRTPEAARVPAPSTSAAPAARSVVPPTPAVTVTSGDDEAIAGHQTRLDADSRRAELSEADLAEIRRIQDMDNASGAAEPTAEDLRVIEALLEGSDDEPVVPRVVAPLPAVRVHGRGATEPTADDLLAIQAALDSEVDDASAAPMRAEEPTADDWLAIHAAQEALNRGEPPVLRRGQRGDVQQPIVDVVRRHPLAAHFLGTYIALCLLGLTRFSINGFVGYTASLALALGVSRAVRDPQGAVVNPIRRLQRSATDTAQDIRRRFGL